MACPRCGATLTGKPELHQCVAVPGGYALTGKHGTYRVQPDGTKDYGDLSSVDPPYQIPMSCSRCKTAWQGCADARDCPECGGDGEGFPEPRVDAFQRRVVGEVGNFRLETDAEFRDRIKRRYKKRKRARR